ncbi:MAG: class I SAM-dependent methyltransferase [Salinirussus sp.]
MGIREGVAEQFSGRGTRADIWHAFDLFLDTDQYLNLGFSRWYQPHALPSSQRRLATLVGQRLTAAVDTHTPPPRLLDVGCGRGGPAIHLSEKFGFEVLGVDLVQHNIARAIENAKCSESNADFVVGDATALPVATGSHGAATAIDALVYLSDRAAVIGEISRILEPGAPLILSDLVLAEDCSKAERDTVAAFADAWDMSMPATRMEYERLIEMTGLRIEAIEDLTPNSIGGFRRWTRPFLRLIAGPVGGFVERLLERYGLDPGVIFEQIRLAHAAVPHLRHLLIRSRRSRTLAPQVTTHRK